MSTNLVEAIRRRRLDIVRSAVAAGASPDQPEPNGHTPLADAALRGYVEGVTTLLALGAKPTTEALRSAMWSDAEWHEAGEAQASTLKCVELLLKAGASPQGILPDHLYNGDWSEKADLVLAAGADPNECDLINHPAERGDLTAIRKLVKAGANLNGDGTRYQRFPLDIALKAGHEEAAELLVSLGASVEARDGDGATALHRMCHYKEDAAVAVLLGMGADISAVDGRGRTPLDVAMENKCVPIIRRLAKAGAPLDVKDKHGLTPLQRVVKRDDVKLVPVLIEGGVDPNRGTENGITPLMSACTDNLMRGFDAPEKMLAALIDAGADPNRTDVEGNTALHYLATSYGHQLHCFRGKYYGAAALLLDRGADAEALNNEAMTPYKCIRRGRSEIVKRVPQLRGQRPKECCSVM